MNKPTITEKSPQEFTVSGELDFDNVTALFQQASEIINRATSQIKFNLSEISQSNSAGLALITGLLRYAKEHHKSVLFLHLPAKLLAAAKISDLDALLQCTPTTSNA